MNRRNFLGLLFGAAAAQAIPEAAVKYFLSPIGGWKSDVILHPPSYDDLTAISHDYMLATIADNYFKVSPLFKPKEYNRWIQIPTRPIRVPVSYR
jgi:hypothetical protein